MPSFWETLIARPLHHPRALPLLSCPTNSSNIESNLQLFYKDYQEDKFTINRRNGDDTIIPIFILPIPHFPDLKASLDAKPGVPVSVSVGVCVFNCVCVVDDAVLVVKDDEVDCVYLVVLVASSVLAVFSV